MQVIGKSLSLAVESGPQAGASLMLLPGTHRIGSGLDCDIVLADPLMAPAHFALEDTPVAALRALDAEVRVQGGPVLRPGEARAIRRPLRFTAGGTRFRLDPPAPAAAAATPGWRSRAAMATVLATAAVILLVAQATPAGTASVASLPAPMAAASTLERGPAATAPTQIPAHATDADPAAALAGRLAAASLAGVHSRVGADGTMEAAGTLSPEQQAAWSDVKRWFDGAYGARVVLVDHVALSAPAAPLSIAAVHPGASPFVIDRSGQKLFPGSDLPGGWVVESIEPTHVLVRRNGQALAVRF